VVKVTDRIGEEKPFSMLFYAPQIPHEQSWDLALPYGTYSGDSLNISQHWTMGGSCCNIGSRFWATAQREHSGHELT
jgi:hypothetical protein